VVSGDSHHRSPRNVFSSMRARLGPVTPVVISSPSLGVSAR
jgi:hypothetical protein